MPAWGPEGPLLTTPVLVPAHQRQQKHLRWGLAWFRLPVLSPTLPGHRRIRAVSPTCPRGPSYGGGCGGVCGEGCSSLSQVKTQSRLNEAAPNPSPGTHAEPSPGPTLSWDRTVTRPLPNRELACRESGDRPWETHPGPAPRRGRASQLPHSHGTYFRGNQDVLGLKDTGREGDSVFLRSRGVFSQFSELRLPILQEP